MNKKGTKKLSGVLAATTVLTSVAGATPAFAQGTNWDALYKTAYEAMQKAEKEKTQESINVARKAIAEVAKNKKLVSMASTLSEKVDAVQQGLFNDLYALMYVDGKPKATMTQEEINKAKALVVSFATCPSNKAYIPTWSSAIDPYQQININKLVEAIKTAETTKKAEDIKAARKLADEFLTVTNADMKKAAESFDVQLAQVEAPEAVKAVEAIKVDELKLENQKEVQAQLDNAKKLVEKVKDEKVKKELDDKIAKSEKAINDKFVSLNKLGVEKAEVVNAKTLKVSFNNSIAEKEQAKVKFAVKRGLANVSLSSNWAKDGKSVELSSKNALTEGQYTVTATGLDFGKTSTTLKVEAQKEKSLTIDCSVLNKNNNAKVKISLKDQYGDDFKLNRGEFIITAFNKTKGEVVKVSEADFTIDTKNANKISKDDVIVVTVLHTKSGLTDKKELKVVDSAYFDTIELGNIELPKGKKILTSDLTNVKIDYKAKDQFGEEIKIDNNKIEVLSSDKNILNPADVSVDTDTSKGTKLTISKFADKKSTGKVKLTIVSKESGQTATIELQVEGAPGEIAKVKTAESQVTIAAGSPVQEVALEVTDQYGSKIEEKDYNGKLKLTSSNSSVIKNDEKALIIKDGKIQLNLENDAKQGVKTTITIINTESGKVLETIAVIVGEKAVPTTIDLKEGSKYASKLVAGATTELEFVVKDQYGNEMKNTGVITADVKDNAENIQKPVVKGNTVTVTAEKEGTAVLEVKLNDKEGKDAKELDCKEITFDVVKNSSKIDLKIGDIPAICKDGKDKKEVKLVTKDGVKLPSSAILQVTSVDEKIVTVEEKDGEYFVKSALSEDNKNKMKADNKDIKCKISVIYNADDKAVTLEKEVTVSAKDRQTEKVIVLDKELTKDNAIDEKAKVVTSVNSIDELKNCNVVEKDNFEAYTKSEGKNVTILVANQKGLTVDKSKFKINDGKLTVEEGAVKANADNTEKKGTFRVILYVNGDTSAIDVNLTNIKDVAADVVKPGEDH
ncbi:hypothetical protein C3495_11780 [Clostridiaceae bacterium 14S0207]|nr:hypothetical protein C3495_11780 [Clostridiaceae bacterium 14S0207]